MPPMIPVTKLNITAKMMMAGIEANAHFTMRTTMEKNGICRSTTITFFASSDSFIFIDAYRLGA